MSEDDRSEQLANNLAAPRRFRGDEGEAEQHSLPDQIAMDRHLANKAAAKSPRKALRMSVMRRPGAAE